MASVHIDSGSAAASVTLPGAAPMVQPPLDGGITTPPPPGLLPSATDAAALPTGEGATSSPKSAENVHSKSAAPTTHASSLGDTRPAHSRRATTGVDGAAAPSAHGGGAALPATHSGQWTAPPPPPITAHVLRFHSHADFVAAISTICHLQWQATIQGIGGANATVTLGGETLQLVSMVDTSAPTSTATHAHAAAPAKPTVHAPATRPVKPDLHAGLHPTTTTTNAHAFASKAELASALRVGFKLVEDAHGVEHDLLDNLAAADGSTSIATKRFDMRPVWAKTIDGTKLKSLPVGTILLGASKRSTYPYKTAGKGVRFPSGGAAILYHGDALVDSALIRRDGTRGPVTLQDAQAWCDANFGVGSDPAQYVYPVECAGAHTHPRQHRWRRLNDTYELSAQGGR